MAGEIHEPFRLSFQVDSIHSGSISFGRFETEPLSWERRSSFSHNKYLEEVEKYSKPGSVTEKKAYFEAHFKRKALLNKTSSGCQNSTEYQTSENDNSENMGFRDDFEHSSAPLDHIDEFAHSVHYDEDSGGSADESGYERSECVRNGNESSFIEIQFENVNIDGEVDSQLEPTANDDNVIACDATGSANVEDSRECHLEKPSEIDVIREQVMENRMEEAANVDLSFKAASFSNIVSSRKDDSPKLEDHHEICHKVDTIRGSKFTKPKVKSLDDDTKVPNNITNEISKDSFKKPVRGSSHSTKTEKQQPHTVSLATSSVRRTPKLMEIEGILSRMRHSNRRDKLVKTEKVVEPKTSSLEKVFPKARQKAHRSKRAESTAKPDMKRTTEVFSFSSDERAERRKEFFMKLEEKMLVKEAEISDTQAKTQEKRQAEIKQFRKSLNFKATPMPSFYYEAEQPGPSKNKIISNNSKSSESQPKSADPACVTKRLPLAHPKGRNGKISSTLEAAYKSDIPRASVETNCSQRVPSEEIESKILGRKEHAKTDNLNLRSHRSVSSSILKRGHKVEDKRKLKVDGSNNRTVRKGLGSVGMRNLAVGIVT